ncbi:MAG: type II toxin-antitoxin system prevent-host-death family antitoxin [Candidatus Schekmanbacteria bacterium]|nr:type II toxin-antitoxin system prevent-host-death family antitoxin [Candidatus Schekmanbacteria bacterium]
MVSIPIHVAKAKLSELIERACAGETVVIAHGKRPMVRLVPVDGATGRAFGAMKGRATVTESFFDPLPAEELDPWQQ